MTSSVICLALITLFGVVSSEEVLQDFSKISTPPSFTHLPNPLVTYYVVETSSDDSAETYHQFSRKKGLACRATGYPNVTFRWLKDDVLLNLTDPRVSERIMKMPGEGSFSFKFLLDTDEGSYQCLAVNENGIAVDRKVQFKKAFIDSTRMAESQPIQTVSVKFGDPWTMNCSAPRSVPPAKLYWILVSAPQNSERRFKTINFTNVAVNDKGAIFFQHVTEGDYHKDYYFACTAENLASNQLKFSNHFNFSIHPNSTRTALDHTIPLIRQYTSPSRITAIKGESFELYCIFSGYPILTPTWLHDGKKMNLSNSRIWLSTNFGKSIKIDNVIDDDKGVYECVFERAPQLNEKFTVTIESIPFWIKKPHNINSSEETDVEFHCNADGNPKPQFEFFKNGQPIELDGDRVVVNGDRLKIKNLKKGENGTGDNAVYQCKAENKNGYIWANFYLNILAYKPFVLDGPGRVEAVVAPTVAPTDFKGNADSYSSATFTWNYANRSSVTGAVKGFVIEYWYVTNKRAEPTYKEAYFDINANTGTVYDMKPNRENFAQIRVFNGAGKSEPSKPPYMIKMPEGVPSHVQRLNATALNDSVITVVWQEPRELNGNLTHYIVKYKLISEDKTKKEKENYQNIVFFNETVGAHFEYAEIRLKDLKAESKYLIEVVGVTRSGEGEPSLIEAETTN